MEDFATLAALAALVLKVTSLIKYLTAGMIREAVTTLVPWVAAFGVLVLAGQADATAALVLPGMKTVIGDMDIASLLLAAPVLGASASVVFDFKKAIDGTDSAAEPKLGGGVGGPGV
jgi:hypothetical protein